MDRIAVGAGGAGAGVGGFGPGRAGADGQALTQIAEQPVVRTSLLASWALALSRWQGLLTPVLWGLILALSMLAAAWLWMVDRRRSLAPVA